MEHTKGFRHKPTQLHPPDFLMKITKICTEEKKASSSNGADKTKYLHVEE